MNKIVCVCWKFYKITKNYVHVCFKLTAFSILVISRISRYTTTQRFEAVFQNIKFIIYFNFVNCLYYKTCILNCNKTQFKNKNEVKNFILEIKLLKQT